MKRQQIERRAARTTALHMRHDSTESTTDDTNADLVKHIVDSMRTGAGGPAAKVAVATFKAITNAEMSKLAAAETTRRAALAKKRNVVNSFRRKRAEQQAQLQVRSDADPSAGSQHPAMVGTSGRRRLFKLPKDKGKIPITFVAGSALSKKKASKTTLKKLEGSKKGSRSHGRRGGGSSTAGHRSNHRSSTAGHRSSHRHARIHARTNTPRPIRPGSKSKASRSGARGVAAPSRSLSTLQEGPPARAAVMQHGGSKQPRRSGKFKRHTSAAPDWDLIERISSSPSLKAERKPHDHVAAAAAEAAAELEDLVFSASMDNDQTNDNSSAASVADGYMSVAGAGSASAAGSGGDHDHDGHAALSAAGDDASLDEGHAQGESNVLAASLDLDEGGEDNVLAASIAAACAAFEDFEQYKRTCPDDAKAHCAHTDSDEGSDERVPVGRAKQLEQMKIARMARLTPKQLSKYAQRERTKQTAAMQAIEAAC